MSKARSGVPGPGEMTILSYVPDDRKFDKADQVSSSFVMTSGSTVTSKQMRHRAAQSVQKVLP